MARNEDNDGRVRDRVGRPSRFRGKDRERPVQVYLTRRGMLAFEAGCLHRQMSRPEYIEHLALKDVSSIPNWDQVGRRAIQLRQERAAKRGGKKRKKRGGKKRNQERAAG